MKNLLVFLCISFSILAQHEALSALDDVNTIVYDKAPSEADTIIYTEADKMPAPVGGIEALMKNVVYPKAAAKEGKEGVVFISTVINEKGEPTVVTVVKSAGDLLDEAAITAIKKSKFTPGEVKGKLVKVKITIPVSFKLSNDKQSSKDKDDILTEAENMPEIVGGMEALLKAIIYPESAKKAGIQGKVFVSAVVNEVGKVVSAEVIKSVHPDLDKAALSAINSISFIPAEDKGKKVKVQIVIPVFFKLQ